MISTSKNMYINKLHNIVNKYKNKYHNTIKMKPVDINSSAYIDFDKKITKLNLKLMIMLEYQNIKTFLKKTMFQIGLMKFL